MKQRLKQVHACVNYLRVSDEDGQYPERSFDYQHQLIEDRLLPLVGLPVSHEYRDIEKGTRNDRVQYQQMLTDARAGMFSDLCVYRIDRFGRSPQEVFTAVNLLESLGVKIWVADMPNLEIGTPNGNLQLGIQTVLAKYEVDLLGQRVRDTKHQQMLRGKWPNHPPEGYVSKREEISSRKYRCWIEPHPVQSKIVREAYDLWLTGLYILQQVCEELNRRGYTRRSGKAWAWDDPATGSRKYAGSHIQRMLSSPFHAGWVVSTTHGIHRGQVRGEWTPLVTDDELDRSLAIMKQHATDKSRERRYVYILRGILWLDYEGKLYLLHGSTLTGRSRKYGYYETRANCGGKKRRVRDEFVERNLSSWLQHIGICPKQIPAVRTLYQQHVAELNGASHKRSLDELGRRIQALEAQEVDLGRLLLTGNISEEAYNLLRREWQDKLTSARQELNGLSRDVTSYLDDLEVALRLPTQIGRLFGRLSPRQQSSVLRILAKKIVIDLNGEFVGWELNPPFEYLSHLAKTPGVGTRSAADAVSGSLTTPSLAEQFPRVARFPQRSKLQSLPDELTGVRSGNWG
jgi:DNA invertase Pin-like site-specific DNA recombinase